MQHCGEPEERGVPRRRDVRRRGGVELRLERLPTEQRAVRETQAALRTQHEHRLAATQQVT